jgi:hypothetical protein
MTFFRTYLVLVVGCLGVYTLLVGLEHGWNLLPLFFEAIAQRSWQGQFNADFLTFLSLSAIWVAWRHRFSPGGNALGVVAFFGGMMFLAAYLLWASGRCNGSAAVLLLGEKRVHC